jgi:hypothetical protein
MVLAPKERIDPMNTSSTEPCDPGDNAEQRALREIEAAKGEIGKGEQEITTGLHDVEKGEHDLEKAEADLEAANRHHDVEVIVDSKPKRVKRGTYVVSAFKALVGVSADRELDIVEGGTFKPLDDNANITIVGCEVFVSHVRTGGSS